MSTGRRARSTALAVALVREEWRVVDRWWTEEPVNRRYFDVVLEGGRARGRLPRRGGGPLVQPARDVSGRRLAQLSLEEGVVPGAELGEIGTVGSHASRMNASTPAGPVMVRQRASVSPSLANVWGTPGGTATK